MIEFEKYMKNEHCGIENAVFSKEIEKIFHMSGSDVRMTVNEMRCRGVPICSSAKGYYYAKTTEDIERTLRHLNSRAEKIQKAREGMQKMLECMEHENTEPYKTGSV